MEKSNTKKLSLKEKLLSIDDNKSNIEEISKFFITCPQDKMLKSCNILQSIFMDIIQTPLHNKKIISMIYLLNEIFKNESSLGYFKNYFKNKLEPTFKEINDQLKFQKNVTSILTNILKVIQFWSASNFFNSELISKLQDIIKIDYSEYFELSEKIYWKDLKGIHEVEQHKNILEDKQRTIQHNLDNLLSTAALDGNKKVTIDIEINRKSISDLSERLKGANNKLITKRFDIIKKIDEDIEELINLDNKLAAI